MRTRWSRVGWLGLAALAGCLLGAGGCESGPYLSGYSYTPQPGVYEVRKHGAEQQPPPMTALVTIMGVRKGDPDHHVGPSIDVRMQFESNGSEQITFDPASLDLVTGRLQPFPRPYVTPPRAVELSSGQEQNVTASFPFPANTTPEQMDLNELRLRWVVRVAGYTVPQTGLFERTGDGYTATEYAPTGPPPGDVAY